jgi:hypothetical protein
LKKQTIRQRNKIKGEENKAKNEKMKNLKTRRRICPHRHKITTHPRVRPVRTRARAKSKPVRPARGAVEVGW